MKRRSVLDKEKEGRAAGSERRPTARGGRLGTGEGRRGDDGRGDGRR